MLSCDDWSCYDPARANAGTLKTALEQHIAIASIPPIM